MKQRLILLLFVIVGLVNFAPLAGVLSREMIEGAYAVEVNSAALELLLRHRAVLFGIVGGLLLVAAFRPALRPIAAVCGFISMISFALLYGVIGPENDALRGVLRFDIVGIVALAAAILLGRSDRTDPANAPLA